MTKKLGVGEHRGWGKEGQPKHDPKRRKYRLYCHVCGYRMHHRLYVCPKCGNCQNCGGLNQIGVINQHCIYCGNGQGAKPIAIPTATANNYAPPDYPQNLNYHAIQDKPIKRFTAEQRGIASGINVKNPFNH
jgi:hypothetical protein